MEQYKEQLRQVDIAISSCQNGSEKDDLIALKNNILELLSLTEGDDEQHSSTLNEDEDPLSDEYALFMAELKKDEQQANDNSNERLSISESEFKNLEGTKCRAPHTHQWGHTTYHNAMICSVVSDSLDDRENIKVRVLFINPTHQEMLPCPYYFESDCKFSEEKCKFSHGEVVLFSNLQEYVEPDFDSVGVGSRVLAKQTNNLWSRAVIKNIYDKKYLVKLEANQKIMELNLENILPLIGESFEENSSSSEEEEYSSEDVINMSLMNTPSSGALGDWEKFTKGVGSKLMQKMGYIVGTGLGKRSDGRLDPVTAVILPPGKSLDHCMQLRENAGGDKNLFSAEKKLKQMQRKQEIQSQKMYEREQKKIDVFKFINITLSKPNAENAQISKSKHRQEIKKETSRNLNVASLKTDEDIKKIERDIYVIKESLVRHCDKNSLMHKNLQSKLFMKEEDLRKLQMQSVNIKNEQHLRKDKRKMTIF